MDLIKERRLRRIQIDASFFVMWLADVSAIKPGHHISWPVIEGIPEGYQVVHAFSDPLTPPSIQIIIGHASFAPVPECEMIPFFEKSVAASNYMIQLTDGQVDLLKMHGHPVAGRKAKLL